MLNKNVKRNYETVFCMRVLTSVNANCQQA